MLHTLAVSNYRSLRQFVAPLGQLTLITGPNGSDKSNVYRALRLLAKTARGGLIGSLAKEGGFASTLWAGPEPFSAAVKRGERPVQATLKAEAQACSPG
jgi:predicted ATPase